MAEDKYPVYKQLSFWIIVSLAAILLLAAGLRLWGLDFGLPFLYHPDEPFSQSIITKMVKTNNFNPGFFRYPSFYFYIHAVTYYPYYWVQNLRGIHSSIQDLPEAIVLVPGAGIMYKPSLLLRGRLFSAFNGVAAVLLVYLCGRRMSGKAAVGLLGAFFMAISPANVNHSHLMTPDSFIVLFALLSLFGSIGVYQTGKIRYYLLAGIAAALSASSKYNGGFIYLALPCAHFLRYGWQGFRNLKIYLGSFAVVFTFFLVNPYILLDFGLFWSDLVASLEVYSTGQPGEEGNQFVWYIQYLLTTEGIIPVLGLAGIINAVIRREKPALVVAAFPIVYFGLILLFSLRNERTIYPLLGMVHILAAYFIVWAAEKLKPAQVAPGWFGAAALAIGCLAAVPAYQSIQVDLRYSQIDSRETARKWINKNLPWNARVVLERYAPYLNEKKFQILTVESMADHPPEWYIEQRVNYLIFSEGIYRRYETNPGMYPEVAAAYERLFDQFQLVKIFNDGGYEIKVYEALPFEP
jgi:4-amino-4-deoxy-L-arabinose transferase-like glycosyltransferase